MQYEKLEYLKHYRDESNDIYEKLLPFHPLARSPQRFLRFQRRAISEQFSHNYISFVWLN